MRLARSAGTVLPPGHRHPRFVLQPGRQESPVLPEQPAPLAQREGHSARPSTPDLREDHSFVNRGPGPKLKPQFGWQQWLFHSGPKPSGSRPTSLCLNIASRLPVTAETNSPTLTLDRNPGDQNYAGFGIPEYWRFDPTGGDRYGAAIAGDRLVGGIYQAVDIEEVEPNHLHVRTVRCWGCIRVGTTVACAGMTRKPRGICSPWMKKARPTSPNGRAESLPRPG